MKQFIFLLLTALIVIIAVIFDIYLIIDVESIINDTKTTWQLTLEIFAIVIGVPLCSRVLIYIVYGVLKLFN